MIAVRDCFFVVTQGLPLLYVTWRTRATNGSTDKILGDIASPRIPYPKNLGRIGDPVLLLAQFQTLNQGSVATLILTL